MNLKGLLQEKKSVDDKQMKMVVEALKTKGSKKTSFRLMLHADKDRLVQSSVQHNRLQDFRPHSDLSTYKNRSPAF